MKPGVEKGWLLFAVILVFFSCQRELYFDISTPPLNAAYTFNLGNDSCTVVERHGIYEAGVELSDSNTVTLKINVTGPGTYKISSFPVNGVLFSDSGSFNAAGIQMIVLKGRGIPADTGTFIFKPAPGGCDFTIHFTRQSSANSARYIMEGAPDHCTGFNVAGTYRVGTILDSSLNYVTVNVNVISTGAYTIRSPEINNMHFSKAGNFTSTGNTTVRLQGSGNPFHMGSDDYTVGIFPGSCTFTVTVADAEPAALGTLNCTAASVSGIYKKSIGLNSTNTISIPVNIITPGSYSISTSNINGCVFSGSGSLQAGNQLIILTGNGIPTDAGLFSFPVSLGNSNCSFNINFEPG